MIPNAVVSVSVARRAWRFSSGRNSSTPNTVPSEELRHRPLVVMAKNT